MLPKLIILIFSFVFMSCLKPVDTADGENSDATLTNSTSTSETSSEEELSLSDKLWLITDSNKDGVATGSEIDQRLFAFYEPAFALTDAAQAADLNKDGTIDQLDGELYLDSILGETLVFDETSLSDFKTFSLLKLDTNNDTKVSGPEVIIGFDRIKSISNAKLTTFFTYSDSFNERDLLEIIENDSSLSISVEPAAKVHVSLIQQSAGSSYPMNSYERTCLLLKLVSQNFGTYQDPFTNGDFDGDGIVATLDLGAWSTGHYAFFPNNQPDGTYFTKIAADDLNTIFPGFGDFNCSTDESELSALRVEVTAKLGLTSADGGWLAVLDLNKDDLISSADLDIIDSTEVTISE